MMSLFGVSYLRFCLTFPALIRMCMRLARLVYRAQIRIEILLLSGLTNERDMALDLMGCKPCFRSDAYPSLSCYSY